MIEQRQKSTRLEFWLDGKHIGHVYQAYHPDIPYEAYVLYGKAGERKSKRVDSIEEAQEWVHATWLEHHPPPIALTTPCSQRCRDQATEEPT